MRIEFKDYSHITKYLQQCFGLLTNREVYVWVIRWDGETNNLGLNCEEWCDYNTLIRLINDYYCYAGFNKIEKRDKKTRDKYCFDLFFTRDEPKSRIRMCIDFTRRKDNE